GGGDGGGEVGRCHRYRRCHGLVSCGVRRWIVGRAITSGGLEAAVDSCRRIARRLGNANRVEGGIARLVTLLKVC
ncbi:MAG: hypothetical protein JWN40_672, partial [Phycisphaerales bacterium]|nr:hypothetical protein [Phycisphaerales bacterium]